MEEIFKDVIYFVGTRTSSATSKSYSYNDKSYNSHKTKFRHFIQKILPPPADVRKVEVRQPAAMEIPKWMRTDVPPQPSEFSMGTRCQLNKGPAQANMTISNLNTTLIGDYVAATLSEYDEKWLVQVFGNATFASILEMIHKDKLIINRRYIFIQLGGNQIRTSTTSSMLRVMMEMVMALR